MIVARKVEDDRVAGFQRINHSLKIRQRATGTRLMRVMTSPTLTSFGSHVGGQTVRIHFFNVETFHAGQSLVGN